MSSARSTRSTVSPDFPLDYALVPRPTAGALRKQGIGDAESLGRLNIAAASAALPYTAHVRQIRSIVAAERAKWITVLDEQTLTHANSQASFIFFNTGRPQTQLAGAMRAQGVDIGRTFPPYANWARITIGLPNENRAVQQKLQEILAANPS